MVKLSYRGYDVVIFIDEISTEISVDALGLELEAPTMSREAAALFAQHILDWWVAASVPRSLAEAAA